VSNFTKTLYKKKVKFFIECDLSIVVTFHIGLVHSCTKILIDTFFLRLLFAFPLSLSQIIKHSRNDINCIFI